MTKRCCVKAFSAVLILLIIIVTAGCLLYPKIRFNIHSVVPNEIYRSAQLPKEQLQQLISQHNIRAIINLRNAHLEEQWYRDELTLAKQHGIALYNLVLPAHGCPTVWELRVLAEALENAPRPMLIHCRHGVDRSGLASALALILRNDASLNNINEQISWKYFVFENNSVGKCVLPAYEKWLSAHHYPSTKENFFSWLESPNPIPQQ